MITERQLSKRLRNIADHFDINDHVDILRSLDGIITELQSVREEAVKEQETRVVSNPYRQRPKTEPARCPPDEAASEEYGEEPIGPPSALASGERHLSLRGAHEAYE
jgi:hypothetical protein